MHTTLVDLKMILERHSSLFLSTTVLASILPAAAIFLLARHSNKSSEPITTTPDESETVQFLHTTVRQLARSHLGQLNLLWTVIRKKSNEIHQLQERLNLAMAQLADQQTVGKNMSVNCVQTKLVAGSSTHGEDIRTMVDIGVNTATGDAALVQELQGILEGKIGELAEAASRLSNLEIVHEDAKSNLQDRDFDVVHLLGLLDDRNEEILAQERINKDALARLYSEVDFLKASLENPEKSSVLVQEGLSEAQSRLNTAYAGLAVLRAGFLNLQCRVGAAELEKKGLDDVVANLRAQNVALVSQLQAAQLSQHARGVEAALYPLEYTKQPLPTPNPDVDPSNPFATSTSDGNSTLLNGDTSDDRDIYYEAMNCTVTSSSDINDDSRHSSIELDDPSYPVPPFAEPIPTKDTLILEAISPVVNPSDGIFHSCPLIDGTEADAEVTTSAAIESSSASAVRIDMDVRKAKADQHKKEHDQRDLLQRYPELVQPQVQPIRYPMYSYPVLNPYARRRRPRRARHYRLSENTD